MRRFTQNPYATRCAAAAVVKQVPHLSTCFGDESLPRLIPATPPLSCVSTPLRAFATSARRLKGSSQKNMSGDDGTPAPAATVKKVVGKRASAKCTGRQAATMPQEATAVEEADLTKAAAAVTQLARTQQQQQSRARRSSSAASKREPKAIRKSSTPKRTASQKKRQEAAATTASDASVAPSVSPPAAALREQSATKMAYGELAQPPVYFTECTTASRPPLTVEEQIAERASITKLFMVSDSVASIFSTVPCDIKAIDNYLTEVDKAVLPRPAHSEGDDNAGNVTSLQSVDDDVDDYATADLQQRILVEENANHTMDIHVRDMEQLVPPSHLVQPPPQASASPQPVVDVTSSSSSLRNGKRRRRKKLSTDAAAQSSPVTASAPGAEEQNALTPLERLRMFQSWQSNALAYARASQERWKIPDSYHAITRVRFHDPHRTDITVVQGHGGTKTVEDVLASINRKMQHGGGTNSDKGDNQANSGNDDDEPNPFQQLEDIGRVFSGSAAALPVTSKGTATLSTPYALKPLLTVFASCIPRRESQLGARVEAHHFLAAGSSSSAATATTAATTAAAAAGAATGFVRNDLTDEMVYSMLKGRGAPKMPRYSTRITLLIEHDELEPADLLSLAEITSPRRREVREEENNKSSNIKASSRRPRIYCLIADGGEY